VHRQPGNMDNVNLGSSDVLSEIVDKVSFVNFVSTSILYKKMGEVTVPNPSTLNCKRNFTFCPK
jgi:hypothetical protein